MSSFDSFKAIFKGDLVTPSDPGYDEAIARWASNAARRAKIVAFVKDAEDVSLAIKHSLAEKLPLAIKCGGHNPAGSSSSEGGLVIDLSRYLNKVTVDPGRKLGYVGGGSVWKTVDEEAIKYGLATVGGTVNHTGVGGLTLGGGYGWLSPAYGLAVDNLTQVTIVTVDGSVLTANDNENSDLFWGVRGGGCNFGVVTEFVLRLHEQRRTVFSGMLIYAPPAIEALAKATVEWWNRGTSSREAMILIMTRSPGGDPSVVVFPFFNGTNEEGREAFKAFLDLNPIHDSCRELPYEELNSVQNPAVPHGPNYYMRGVMQEDCTVSSMVNVFNKMVQLSADKPFTLSVIWEFFSLEKINEIAPDATAFPGRGKRSNVLCSARWIGSSPEVAKAVKTAAYSVTDIVVNAETDKKGAAEQFYANYAGDVVDADRSRALFKGNYERLQQLKKKFDPQVIFDRWWVIAPAA